MKYVPGGWLHPAIDISSSLVDPCHMRTCIYIVCGMYHCFNVAEIWIKHVLMNILHSNAGQFLPYWVSLKSWWYIITPEKVFSLTKYPCTHFFQWSKLDHINHRIIHVCYIMSVTFTRNQIICVANELRTIPVNWKTKLSYIITTWSFLSCYIYINGIHTYIYI